jgi:hypothetical protein
MRRSLTRAGRACQVLIHQTHYHDELLRDIDQTWGSVPCARATLLSKYLMTYRQYRHVCRTATHSRHAPEVTNSNIKSKVGRCDGLIRYEGCERRKRLPGHRSAQAGARGRGTARLGRVVTAVGVVRWRRGVAVRAQAGFHLWWVNIEPRLCPCLQQLERISTLRLQPMSKVRRSMVLFLCLGTT